MCFWQWLIANREPIMVLANIATVLALGFVAWALIYSAKAFKLQKENMQASLFHNITVEINQIISQQKACEDQGWDHVKNWYERLIDQ